MKKTLTTLICVTAVMLGTTAFSGTKKNDPNKKDVDKELKEIGGDHYVERMKVDDLCSLKFEDAADEDVFYHIYTASLKKGGYRVIVYNNVPEYLGYYATEFEPVDYEEDKVLLDSGESDEDGNTDYISLPLTLKGPAAKVRIDGTPTAFVKNPNLEVKGAAATTGGGIPVVLKETSATGEIIDYRDWTITMKGKQITVNAKFEKIEDGKVYIKNAKNSKIAPVPGSALSDADKEYVKRITAK